MKLRLAAAAALIGLLPTASVAEQRTPMAQPEAIIELFTSQGCSSCPPADKLMGEYAERDDVLALSFNVDIWDWIGWKDTLASEAHTQRQRAYAAAMGERSVYTPQAVIDGRIHVVGSDRDGIERALAETRPLSVPIELTATADSITVDIEAADGDDAPHAMLWLVLYDRAVTVDIGRGENSGRTVTYNNVVRKLRPVAMWKGEAMSIDMSKAEIDHAGADGCALLLQVETDEGHPGPMLGAARIAASW